MLGISTDRETGRETCYVEETTKERKRENDAYLAFSTPRYVAAGTAADVIGEFL
jgi:hypothetical protein